MKKKLKIKVFIFFLIIVVKGIFFFTRKKKKDASTVPVSQNTAATPVLFADSPLSKNAYLISNPTLDSKAEEATMGFTITRKTMPDGSMQISLTTQNPAYKNQTYTVKPGEKLYFIEKFLADDN